MRRPGFLLSCLFVLSGMSLERGWSQTIELRSPHEEVGGGFGSVGVVPDVNGDGFDDIVVGAGQEDVAGATEAGRVYIFDGVSTALLHTLISPNAEVGGFFGASVSGVADVNGDGRGEVLVGAGRENVGTVANAGRAYLFDGASGELLHTVVSPFPELDGEFGGGDLRFPPYQYFQGKRLVGNAVSGLEDVNGDDRADFVVGAWKEEGEGVSTDAAGRAYVFDGSSGSLIHTLNSSNEEYVGFFGISVSGVKDVNGDGRGDVVVGAHYEGPGFDATGGHGRAYLFDGSTGALLDTLNSPNPEVSAVFGGIGGLFGNVVSGVPDVNGDGREDMVIGALTEGPEGSGIGYVFDGMGRAYIFDGSNGEVLHTLESPTGVIRGMFGCSVAGIADIDGDGNGDVAVGAIGEVNGGGQFPALDSGGRVHLFSGSSGEALATLISPNEMIGGFFGVAVTGVEDLNGDGLGEVLVGARNENPDGSPEGAGRAYLFLSQPIPSSTQNWGLYK